MSVCGFVCRVSLNGMIRMTPPTRCLLLLLFASSLVASMAPLCEAFGTPRYRPRAQRRFMWKHMDSTVDAMRSMFSDLLTEPSPSPVTSALKDFHMPPDTMRVKYIIRKPSHMKPVKVIKLRATPKKVIKIMAVSPTPHYHHPSTKFPPHQQQQQQPRPSSSPMHSLPSSEDLRKLEKEQELKAEAQYNSHSADGDTNPTPNEVVSGKIQAYDGWTAVYGPGGSGGGGGATASAVAEPLTSNEAGQGHEEHHATVKAYPMSKLHTNVLAEPLRQDNKHRDEYEDDGNEGNNPNDDEYDQSQSQYHSYAPSTNSYEVVEHQAEETVSLPQTHDLHTGQTRSGFRPLYSRGAARTTATTTTSTTTTTSSPTTTEAAPNYPAAYLRKLREREKERERAPLLAGSSSNISQRFRPSAETSNWLPISATANTSAAHLQYPSLRLTKPSGAETMQKAEKWQEEMPPPKPRPFLMAHGKAGGSNGGGGGGGHGGGAALPPKAELLQKKSPVTFENPEALPQDAEHHTRRRVKLRENKHRHNGGVGGAGGSGGDGPTGNAYKSESQYRHRGSIKFGDKLNIDELVR